MLISSALHSALNWTGTPISCSAVFVLWSFSLQHQLLKICCNDGGTEIVVHYAKGKMYSAGNFSCKLYQINESVFSCLRNMLGNGSGKTLAVMIFAKSVGAVVNSMKPNWSVKIGLPSLILTAPAQKVKGLVDLHIPGIYLNSSIIIILVWLLDVSCGVGQ